MADFKVKTQGIRNNSDQLNGFARKVDDVKTTTENILSQLIRYTSVGKSIQSRLRSEISKVQSEGDKLRIYANALNDIAALYEDTEGKLAGTEGASTKINQIASEAAEALKDIKETLGNDPSSQYSADPVNLSTGNYIYEYTDLQIDGYVPLVFKRFYNAQDDTRHHLGIGMLHNYEVSLVQSPHQSDIAICMEDGQWQHFLRKDDGTYEGLRASTGQLSEIQTEDGKIVYQLLETDQSRYIFAQDGRLIRKEDNNQSGVRFEYNENNLLSKAISDSGACLTYHYEKDLLHEVDDQNGHRLIFSYEEDRLSSVLQADGSALRYLYGKNHKISEVLDASNISNVKNIYDAQNRIIRQEFPDGSFMVYEYGDHSVTLQERNGSRTTYLHDEQLRNTDILYEDGTSEHFEYNQKNQRVLIRDRNGNSIRVSYDDRGNLVKLLDASGRRIHANYDAENRLLSVSVNGINRLKNVYDTKGNLLSSEGADGDGITTVYDEAGRPVARIDRDGNRTEISYDDKGNILSVLEGGVLTKYIYDALNRVEASIDGNGNETRYAYDDRGRVAQVTNAKGDTSAYTYDVNGLLKEVKDFDGYRISAKYNVLKLQEETIDKEGNATKYFYDKMWNLQRQENPDGGSIEYLYDQNNRLSCTTMPEGGKISYTYDGNGNLVAKTDADGGVESYVYDASNRMVEQIDPEGNHTKYEYDIFDNLIAETDALGNVTHYEYDENDRKIGITDALGQKTRLYYTKGGELSKVEYPNGSVQSFRYEHGRVAEVQYADGNCLRCLYDGNGNLTDAENKIGNKVHYRYDELNRVIEMVLPNGGVRKLSYTSIGKIKTYTDENGNMTQYSYSPNGNLLSVLDAMGFETRYEYDCMNHMVSMQRFGEDGVIQKTSYAFDKEDHILSVTNPLGIREEFDYDLKGRVISRQDGDGLVTQYQYNHNDDVTGILYSDHRKVSYQYDALRHLQEVQDWNGTTKLHTDALGRILSVTDPLGKTVSYEWGSINERQKVVYPDGTALNYRYDAQGRLSALETPDGTTQYAYDEVGRVREKVLPNGIQTKYEFNDLGRISSLVHQGANISETLRFSYDLAGRKTETERIYGDIGKKPEKESFSYDALNRLTSILSDGSPVREYNYDAFGNRTKKHDFQNGIRSETSYRYNVNNELLEELSDGKNLQYTYDKRGNLHRVMENGEVTKQFYFDSAEDLNQVIVKDGTESKFVTYFYDSFGHRIGEESDGAKTQYTLDLTRDYNNLLSREKDGKAQSYFWDNILLGLKDPSGSAYYLQDDLGSVRHLTDENARAISSYYFDEFGENLYPDSDYERQIFGYTGYQKDALSGLWYAQARRYDAGRGRFISQDILQGDASQPYSLNRYSYCYNDPEDNVDEDGRFVLLTTLAIVAGGAAIGGLVGGGVSVVTQLVDRHNKIKKGEQPEAFNWGKVWGSTAQGVITGGVAAIPGLGPAAAIGAATIGGAAGGFVNSVISQGWGDSWNSGLTNKDKINWRTVAKDTVVSGVLSGVMKYADKFLFDPIKDKVSNGIKDRLTQRIASGAEGSKHRISNLFLKYLTREKASDISKHLMNASGILSMGSMWNLYRQYIGKSFLSSALKQLTKVVNPKEWLKKLYKGGFEGIFDRIFPEPQTACVVAGSMGGR